MLPATYLVFGDLHGRVLPAFRLAQAWSRENGVALAGLLQVGDLGEFPSRSRFDQAAQSVRQTHSLEGGVGLVAQPSEEADMILGGEPSTPTMWFTAGNHENYEELRMKERRSRLQGASSFVDVYAKLCCIRDGQIAELRGGLRVGALWGIDDKAPRARERIPAGGCISRRSAESLSTARFDVLLTHESPRDAVLAGHGSEAIGQLIRKAQPSFVFFGHYHTTGREIEGDFGTTRVYHLSHFELDSRAEEASVGVLAWDGSAGGFAYLDPAWLRTVSRHNWRHR
jgi:hypothetical protein